VDYSTKKSFFSKNLGDKLFFRADDLKECLETNGANTFKTIVSVCDLYDVLHAVESGEPEQDFLGKPKRLSRWEIEPDSQSLAVVAAHLNPDGDLDVENKTEHKDSDSTCLIQVGPGSALRGSVRLSFRMKI